MSARRGQTPSQTVGPFFAYGLTPTQYGYPFDSIAGPQMAEAATPGERIRIEGQVLDGAGEPIPDAMLEFWQADSAGRYVPAHGANAAFSSFGRCGTGVLPGGLYRVDTIKPGAPEGEAPHVDVVLFMRGLLVHAFTRLYFEGEAANATDPVLAQVPAARRDTLIAQRTAPGLYRFDIRMQGPRETVFFDL